MKKKRIQRCWPATIGRRLSFLKPRSYTHRDGRTAALVLVRATVSLRALIDRVEKRKVGVWSLGDEDALRLPRRAEDLLHVLAHNKLMAQKRRGVTTTELAAQYGATPEEIERAVNEVRRHMTHARSHQGDTHSVGLADALTVIDNARHTLEPEPIVT